jgi:hypothetical protein
MEVALVGYLPCGCVGAAMLPDGMPPEEVAKERRAWKKTDLRMRAVMLEEGMSINLTYPCPHSAPPPTAAGG